MTILRCCLCSILIGGEIEYFDEITREFVTRPRTEQTAHPFLGMHICDTCKTTVRRHPKWIDRKIVIVENETTGEIEYTYSSLVQEIKDNLALDKYREELQAEQVSMF